MMRILHIRSGFLKRQIQYFLTNEKTETLSIAIEDLYVPISVATNTRLYLKGWTYNDSYRLSGIQCYANGNNNYVDIDLKIFF